MTSVDQVVYPGRMFGASEGCTNIFERYQQIFRGLYKYTPTRRSGPYQRRDYLRRVCDLATGKAPKCGSRTRNSRSTIFFWSSIRTH